MRFKVGDKVRVREDLVVNEWYGLCYFARDMEKFKGKVFTIKEVFDYYAETYHLAGGEDWEWTDSMLEPVEEKEMVDHPSHYNQFKRETIEEMRLLFGDEAVKGFCKCNAYKYQRRAKFKENEEEDLNKAEWYLDYLEKMEKGEYYVISLLFL